ncbi:hypothetical protein [Streptomyces sp. NPDC096193]|uniref:hypothetical protein n=1 Tax=Streptomyces sp. NPDC096193 TaxID=3155821 RepID=UPI00332D284D
MLYKFRTSAFDGSLYETAWSPWTDFRIAPYVQFPVELTSSTIDSEARAITELNRTDPWPALPTVAAAGAVQRQAAKPLTCGREDAKGRKLCIELSPSHGGVREAGEGAGWGAAQGGSRHGPQGG